MQIVKFPKIVAEKIAFYMFDYWPFFKINLLAFKPANIFIICVFKVPFSSFRN